MTAHVFVSCLSHVATAFNSTASALGSHAGRAAGPKRTHCRRVGWSPKAGVVTCQPIASFTQLAATTCRSEHHHGFCVHVYVYVSHAQSVLTSFVTHTAASSPVRVSRHPPRASYVACRVVAAATHRAHIVSPHPLLPPGTSQAKSPRRPHTATCKHAAAIQHHGASCSSGVGLCAGHARSSGRRGFDSLACSLTIACQPHRFAHRQEAWAQPRGL